MLPKGDSYRSSRRTAFGVAFNSRLKSECKRSETDGGGGYSLTLSVLKVANFIVYSSTLLAGMMISKRANLSFSQVDGGANEPVLLMSSALTTFALQSILPDIRC